jgi:hypothetical protein
LVAVEVEPRGAKLLGLQIPDVPAIEAQRRVEKLDFALARDQVDANSEFQPTPALRTPKVFGKQRTSPNRWDIRYPEPSGHPLPVSREFASSCRPDESLRNGSDHEVFRKCSFVALNAAGAPSLKGVFTPQQYQSLEGIYRVSVRIRIAEYTL